jgi:hypothetical protein
MVKYFCDICGKEMSDQDRGRIKVKRGRVSVEIMTALDGIWNNGQICHSCIVDVVFAYGERSRDVFKLDPEPVMTFFPIDPSEEDKRMFETVEDMRRELSEVLAGKGRRAE